MQADPIGLRSNVLFVITCRIWELIVSISLVIASAGLMGTVIHPLPAHSPFAFDSLMADTSI